MFNSGIVPKSFLDLISSFDISADTTDDFDATQPVARTVLSSNITDVELDIPLDDITVFYPPDLPDDVDNPGGVPSATSEWGTTIIHFETGEIALVQGFTLTGGTSGLAHVVDWSPDIGRGIVNTTATSHTVGEKVASFVSSVSHRAIILAVLKIEEEINNIFDYSSGHDHSGSQKGKPLPAAGLQAGSVVGSKIATGAIDETKLDTPSPPSSGQILSYNGIELEWGAIASTSVEGTFNYSDLVSGMLTVNHGFDGYVVVYIYNDDDKCVLPCNIEYIDSNSVGIDLQSFSIASDMLLTETWKYRVVK